MGGGAAVQELQRNSPGECTDQEYSLGDIRSGNGEDSAVSAAKSIQIGIVAWGVAIGPN